ncbi:RidA family protein [Salegentibacter sediminis]|uniref:RidA family protein n=1 Tax=Salegentibacter sediminis TaxID=1930251 RepID=UPI0009BEE55A|nr:RidA family protein [Salegentibacter sediminis]
MKKLIALLLLAVAPVMAQTPEERLVELGIALPEVRQPSATFVKWRQVGNLLYLAGEGSPEKGTLGKDLSTQEGREAARNTGIRILATLKAATGDLGRIKQFVKVRGMVNSAPDFYEQPQVINGFSDLMVEVFGERGKHARAAVGHVSLPSNIAVEIEVVVELED